MEQVKLIEDYQKLDKNRFVGSLPVMTNSIITFNGQNNILFCEEGVILENCRITFQESESVVFLCKNKHVYKLDVSLYHNSVFYVGQNNYFNGSLHVIVSEEKNVIIGDDNLFSFDIWARTADPHLIYSIESRRRINPSKNIIIGDHVWIGQHAMLLKGTTIGSGSVIGAMGVVSGKIISSNSIWGGNPVRKIADNIVWDGSCVHRWRQQETDNSMVLKTGNNNYIFNNYAHNENILESLENKMTVMKTSNERLEYFLNEIRGNYSKGRFAVCEKQKKISWFRQHK